MPFRPRTQAALVAAASLAATAAVIATPSVWAGETGDVHAVVNTCIALTALFTALVVVGRLGAEPELIWVGFLAGLVLLAGGNLPFSVIPPALGDSSYFAVWAPLFASSLGAALIACSGVAGDRPLARSRPWVGLSVAIGLGSLVVIAAVVDVLQPVLDGAIGPAAPVHHIQVFGGPGALVAARCLGVFLWTVAALGFVRRAERRRDSFAAWVAAGSVLEAFARVQNLVVPASSPHWFFLADAFRLGGYLLLAAGAVRELTAYWRRLADVAVLEERRRMARDIHDGLAQELAFIAAEAKSEDLAHAAHRALDESRRAIAALTRPIDEPVAVAVAQAAEEIGQRWGTRVRVVLDECRDVDADAREQLVRIVREAVTNAARHSGAQEITVEVGGGAALRLRVVDGGRGFDPAAPGVGHGLVSMRERARALGATFDVHSGVGAGTAVEVTFA